MDEECRVGQKLLMSGLDLDAYFERIGYVGEKAPTFSVLDRIVKAHVEAIPFENLDVLLERPIEIEPRRVFSKFVERRRGGYCFEHNGFFGAVLEQLGFSVEYLSGRVRIQREPEFTPARTHLFLLVNAANDEPPRFVDVGVGGLSVTSSLPAEAGRSLETPHEPRRFVDEATWRGPRADGESTCPPGRGELLASLGMPVRRWFHQAYFGGVWHDVVEFTGERMPPIDRTLANFFTSRHPESHFKNRLMAARAIDGGRLTLLNDRLLRRTILDGEETIVERRLETKEELATVLATDFGLVFDGELPFFRP